MRAIKAANLNLFEHDESENIIGEIPRHPIGVFFMTFGGVIFIVFILTVLFFAARNQSEVLEFAGLQSDVDITAGLSFIAMFLIVFVMLFTFIGIYVWNHNLLVVTDQKLVLIFNRNIISRRISQLSIGDVQDVTIDQNTLMSRLFNYGTIRIETSGEQANFTFPYAANPHECGKIIVDAHEKNLKLYGN